MKIRTKIFLIITLIILVLAIAGSCIYYFLFFKKIDAGKKEIPTTSASSSYETRLEMLEDNFSDFSYRLKFVETEDEYFRNSFEEFKKDFELIKEQIKLLDENEEKVSEIEAKMQQLENKLNNLNNSLNLVFSNYSNANLLINGDFRVNQRGKTSLSNIQGYFIDRWNFLGDGEGLSVQKNNDGSVTLINESVDKVAYFCQSVEFAEKYSNQVFTMSIKVLEFSGLSNFYIYDGSVDKQDINSTGILSKTYTTNSDISIFRATISIPANSSLTIAWIKLESGSVATAFSPKSYSVELLDCQRYYTIIGNAGWEIFGNGVNSSTTKSVILIVLPVEMREKPKFSYTGSFRLIIGGGAPSVSKLEMDIYASSKRAIVLDATSSGLSTTSSASMLGANNSNAKLIFDAEIY